MSEIENNNTSLTILTKEQARSLVTKINACMNEARQMLLELHEKRGWEALGYKSWRECVTAEFQQSQCYLYFQLKAAKVERNISTIVEKNDNNSTIMEKPIPESQLRPLTKLNTPEDQTTAWSDAVTTAESEGREVTAKDTERAAGKIKKKSELIVNKIKQGKEVSSQSEEEKQEWERDVRINILVQTCEDFKDEFISRFNKLQGEVGFGIIHKRKIVRPLSDYFNEIINTIEGT